MPRILFVKTSSLGDVVHHCPAVSDAARALPGAEIDWVVEEGFAAVASMHRSVRRVIPVSLRRWRARAWSPAVWREIGAFRRALAAERYDCVVDTQGLIKSAAIAALAKGERHGLDGASAREPLAARFYQRRHRVPRGLHAVERNRRLAAAALGYAVQGPCDYGLFVENSKARPPRGPYAVLLTMTSRADKLWPEARWRELARGLAAHGLRLVLPWGGAAERARCERIAAGIEGASVPPRMPLGELAGVLGAARCAVGVDTGLAHLAVALGVPTAGIYCGSDPELTGLYGARTRNVGAAGRPPAAGEVLEALESLC
ncbi:MAG TPA: lipopolysaccharide heptosyltransferase I [Myxococcota bacterium]|nr:lipopolysaccharide heptosyltransferase I [Myxococcota bacterium]